MSNNERRYKYECDTCGVGKIESDEYLGEVMFSACSACRECGSNKNRRVTGGSKAEPRKLTIMEKIIGYFK